MKEASWGRVTLTLGRSGQVVKRAGPASDVDFSDSHPVTGIKRPVRDRFGSNVDSSLLRGSQLNNKRRARSDDNQKGIDLCEKLSRMGTPPPNSYETLQRMPDSRERMPEPRETSISGRLPSTRSADDLPCMTSIRISPPRNVEELQRRPVNRTYDDVRTVPYMGKDVLDAPMPVSTASFVTKSTFPTTSAKTMPPGPPNPSPISPPSSIVQKVSCSGDEHRTVEGLLHSLGLGKYAIIFKAAEVDMTALKQIGENDLKELGIPMDISRMGGWVSLQIETMKHLHHASILSKVHPLSSAATRKHPGVLLSFSFSFNTMNRGVYNSVLTELTD
ncbi:hypothetical protein CRYUN_Cryun29cG0045500 [Craigia yunnanensis]